MALQQTGTDSWIVYDASPEELVDYYVDRAAAAARASTQDAVDAVLAGRSSEVYFQWAMTFEEANAVHLDGGHEPVRFGEDGGPGTSPL